MLNYIIVTFVVKRFSSSIVGNVADKNVFKPAKKARQMAHIDVFPSPYFYI